MGAAGGGPCCAEESKNAEALNETRILAPTALNEATMSEDQITQISEFSEAVAPDDKPLSPPTKGGAPMQAPDPKLVQPELDGQVYTVLLPGNMDTKYGHRKMGFTMTSVPNNAASTPSGESAVFVGVVKEGALANWNLKNGNTAVVRPGDRLLSVNDTQGDIQKQTQALREALDQGADIVLQVFSYSRPGLSEFLVQIERTATDWQLGFSMKACATNLVIANVKDTGLLPEWNAKSIAQVKVGDGFCVVKAGDVITAVNGQFVETEALGEIIVNGDSLQIRISREAKSVS